MQPKVLSLNINMFSGSCLACNYFFSSTVSTSFYFDLIFWGARTNYNFDTDWPIQNLALFRANQLNSLSWKILICPHAYRLFLHGICVCCVYTEVEYSAFHSNAGRFSLNVSVHRSFSSFKKVFYNSYTTQQGHPSA